MGKGAKINYNFDNHTEDEFYKAVVLIYKVLMINIGIFTDTPMDLIALKKAITLFDEARTAPYYDGIGADISAARTAVQTIVTTNGTWFNNFCAGALSLLTKTGYPLAKESEAQKKLEATILILSIQKINGTIGFLIYHIPFKSIKYGIMYTLTSNTETDPSKWTQFFYAAGQRDGIIAGLTSKAEYKFSSFAMGTDRDLTYSEPAIINPQ